MSNKEKTQEVVERDKLSVINSLEKEYGSFENLKKLQSKYLFVLRKSKKNNVPTEVVIHNNPLL